MHGRLGAASFIFPQKLTTLGFIFGIGTLYSFLRASLLLICIFPMLFDISSLFRKAFSLA